MFLIAAATLRIVLTYDVFNHTIDEPAHIACGMEWLDKGTYRLEAQHPPLARVAAALGPYLDGARSVGRQGIYNEGAAILYWRNTYDRTLRLARMGILPFFWIASIVVYLWARRALAAGPALIAVLIFTSTPSVLAHGGLATTDMALTAFLTAAFLAGVRWAETPTLARSALLGVTGALAVLSKFSSLPFFAAGAGLSFAWWYFAARPSFREARAITARRALPALLALAVCLAVIWSGYRFSHGNTGPAPELFTGIDMVLNHNAAGHVSYLLGERSDSGFWYYYPVALAVKTPLGFGILALLGLGFWWTRRRDSALSGVALACALGAGILIVGLASRINIGTRHVLPLYTVFAILGAFATSQLLNKAAWMKWPVLILLAWGVAGPAFDHPDYLAYMNELAPAEPEKVLVDSDLDWGQDMKRLGSRLQELHADRVTFNPFIIAYLEKAHGFPPIQPMDPLAPSPGWNAVSVTELKLDRLGLDSRDKAQPWPERVKPHERVGRSVLLYYFAPPRE